MYEDTVDNEECIPHIGAVKALRQLDHAVYCNIICNPNHGLTQEQFKTFMFAHCNALAVIKAIDIIKEL